MYPDLTPLMSDEQPKPSDPREQDVVSRATSEAIARTLRDIGAVVQFIPGPSRDSIARAKAAQAEEREDAAKAMVASTAKELYREKLCDSLTTVQMANVVLRADGDERAQAAATYGNLSHTERDEIQHCMAAGLRLRRPAWQKVSQLKTEQVLREQLKEHFARPAVEYFGPTSYEAALDALAKMLAGPVWNAAVHTLSGYCDVTALEFSRAILKCGDPVNIDDEIERCGCRECGD